MNMAEHFIHEWAILRHFSTAPLRQKMQQGKKTLSDKLLKNYNVFAYLATNCSQPVFYA